MAPMKSKTKKQALAGMALMLALVAVVALSIPDPLRLHIIANSDSELDQTVKLQVRDALLEEMSAEMSNAHSKAQARTILLQNGDRLQATAEKVLADAGLPYGAKLYIGMSDFPDRTYGDTFYPAGKYEALRVVLGSGEGHNWWCVMYPPLCIGKLKPSGPIRFKSALLSLFEKGRQPT